MVSRHHGNLAFATSTQRSQPSLHTNVTAPQSMYDSLVAQLHSTVRQCTRREHVLALTGVMRLDASIHCEYHRSTPTRASTQTYLLSCTRRPRKCCCPTEANNNTQSCTRRPLPQLLFRSRYDDTVCEIGPW